MNAIAAPYPQTSGDRETQLCRRIMQLERERDVALDRVLELETALKEYAAPPEDLQCLQAIGLRPLCARVIAALLSRTMATRQQLFLAAYQDNLSKLEEVSDHGMAVHICHARKVLRPYGVAIDRAGMQGWLITPENKARLRTAMGRPA